MDGDEPLVEDEMTEEQPMEDEGIDDVTLKMAANIAGELDKEAEPEPDPKETLRMTYREIAAEMPLVQEVINGLTTFREGLDEVLTEMYKVGDESSLREFVGYYHTMDVLLGGALLEKGERHDLYKFSLLHSVKAHKKFRRDQLLWTGSSAAVLGAGEYLVRQPKYFQIGLILRAAGLGGVAGAATTHVTYLLRGHKLGKRASAIREVLYKAADILDAEVKELFGKQDS